MSKAPIALFVYNRPSHTRLTVEALIRNEGASDTDLYIFSDGPRNELAVEDVFATRKFINDLNGFKNVTIIECEHNKGLSNSIIDGVTHVISKHERVIVLEDDLVTSPFFLDYMNTALDLYKDDDRVGNIHGWVFPIKNRLPETFFRRGADCWGWATWQRAWKLFEKDGSTLLTELSNKRLLQKFDLNGSCRLSEMLKQQILGNNDSWAIRWHAKMFLLDKLCLYPGKSLIQNIGTDGSGRHGAMNNTFDVDLSSDRIVAKDIPIEECSFARKEIIRFYRSRRKKVFLRIFTAIYNTLKVKLN